MNENFFFGFSCVAIHVDNALTKTIVFVIVRYKKNKLIISVILKPQQRQLNIITWGY